MSMPTMIIPGMKLAKGKRSRKEREVEIHPATNNPMEDRDEYTDEQKKTFYVRMLRNSAGTLSMEWANVKPIPVMKDGKQLLNDKGKKVSVAELEENFEPQPGDVLLGKFWEDVDKISMEIQSHLDGSNGSKLKVTIEKELQWPKRVGLIPTANQPLVDDDGETVSRVRLTRHLLDEDGKPMVDEDGKTLVDKKRCRYSRLVIRKAWGQAQSGWGIPEFAQVSID
jgi:hypothetical protein